MKVSKFQKELFSESIALDIAFGACMLDEGKLLMRVKPVNYILNSALIVDAINRNKILVVNLEKGTTYFIEGTKCVTPVTSEIKYHDF